MVARFLHFFPQYTLADLRRMPVQDFHFLMAGLLDVASPQVTEPFEEKAARAVRAQAERAAARARERKGR